MRVTTKKINAELRKAGFDNLTLVKDTKFNYFYFAGHEASSWYCASVMVPKLSCLTLDQWVNEALYLSKGMR